jgi:hypothetical protein
MVDRSKRDSAREILRNFIDCKLTNDEFHASFPSSEHDSALRAIRTNVWMLYSDLHTHNLSGSHKPNAEARALLERCVLFLDSDFEFEWPVPKIGLANILPNLRRRFRETSPDSETLQTEPDSGDHTVWPFFRRSDYDGRCESD